MPSPQQIPHILVIDNYAPNHPDYERLAQTTGIVFRKTVQERITKLCQELFLQDVQITFQKAEELSREKLKELLFKPKWDLIIVSGSPFTIDDQDEWITNQIHVYQQIFEQGIHAPFLGICFGHQLMAIAAGGKVDSVRKYYHGDAALLLENGDTVPIHRSHRYYVSDIPKKANVLATSEDMIEEKRLPYAFVYDTEHTHRIVTLQPHPECSVTCQVVTLLREWLGLSSHNNLAKETKFITSDFPLKSTADTLELFESHPSGTIIRS